MIVGKAVNMAKKMNIPILGLVENMSYLSCPDCGKQILYLVKAISMKWLKIMVLKCLPESPLILRLLLQWMQEP